MTKHRENGQLIAVHIYMNADDYALCKELSKKLKKQGKGRCAPSELIREFVHNALRGLRPGQIVGYDRFLMRELEKAQHHLTKATLRIQNPKQGTTVILPKGQLP